MRVYLEGVHVVMHMLIGCLSTWIIHNHVSLQCSARGRQGWCYWVIRIPNHLASTYYTWCNTPCIESMIPLYDTMHLYILPYGYHGGVCSSPPVMEAMEYHHIQRVCIPSKWGETVMVAMCSPQLAWWRYTVLHNHRWPAWNHYYLHVYYQCESDNGMTPRVCVP